MKKYALSQEDVCSHYFHFTKEKNLAHIEQVGLLPKKGFHAKYIEMTKKVFFVQGLDNLLILFDCWLNVYMKMPRWPDSKFTYGLGSKAMRSNYFPMFFVDLYFWWIKNSKRHRTYAYQVFQQLLDECVLLKLDIEEGKEFSWSDLDEIKEAGYRKRHLIELGYSTKYADLSSSKMDPWNLHTFSNQGVEANKLSLCTIKDSSSMKDILFFALEQTTLNLEEVCPVLADFLKNYLQK